MAVVIPHYQRQRGILARALRSILEQDYQGGICVLAVDDGSPIPARDELEGLPQRPDVEIRVIEQSNARCAAARNTGLAAAPPETLYAAVLDADDWWSPDHLSRAVSALERGHDFYFSNWMPLGLDQDAFSYFGRIDLSQHEKAPWAEDLWLFRGKFFDQELTNPIGRVSTTVFRRDRLGDLRFNTAFTNCCEDIFFRLEVACRSPSVAFSSRVEMYSGDGVNTFSARPWGSLGFFEVARDQLEFVAQIKARFTLTPEQERVRREKQARTRRLAIANMLILLKRGTLIPMSTLRQLRAADPGLLAALPSAFFRGLKGNLD